MKGVFLHSGAQVESEEIISFKSLNNNYIVSKR